jgi:hypothetical protein
MNPSSPHFSWAGCRRASQNSLNWLSNRGANWDCVGGAMKLDGLMVFEKNSAATVGRRSGAVKQIAPHLLLHSISKTAHVTYDAFRNAESAYQLPHYPLMY